SMRRPAPASSTIRCLNPNGPRRRTRPARSSARRTWCSSAWTRRSERMLLLIDNYDSFTYNLVQYLGELGADVHVHRNDAITLEQIEAWAPEQIVISPGPCTPNEAGISVALINRFAGKTPIFGVCLGHQAIGQAFGGNIVRARRV